MKLKNKLKLLLLCIFLGISSSIYGVEYKKGIEQFPESYRPYLYALQAKHPNWTFTAMYTGLDWENVIKKESHLSNRLTVSLAPSSWEKAWHYFLTNGSTNRVEQGWVTASSNAVRHTMDPRNFLNEKTIFQFEEMTYNKDIHTLEGVEQILYGTEMSKTITEQVDGKNVTRYVIKDIEYYQIVTGEDKLKTTIALNLRKTASSSGEFIKTIAKGTTVTTLELTAATDDTGIWAKIKLSDGTEGYACRKTASGTEYLVAAGKTTTEYVKYLYDKNGDGKAEETMTYAEAYMLAAEQSGVSPYILALRTKNETGCKISSNGQISGNHSTYPGYYNYYSIGAYGANPMANGVLYAKNHGWTNPVIAMIEGAKFLGDEYILAGQNTPYLEKYNVNSKANNGLYSHQYMTDITCIYRESLGMYATYKELNILDNAFEFIIPVYNNMPEVPYDIYLNYEDYFQEEKDEIVTNKSTAIYSLVPTTATGVQRIEMVTVPAGTKLELIASGLASSYDRIKYTVDGSAMYGYIFYTSYDIATVPDNTKLEVIASPWVRLRSKPNTSSSQVCLLYTGDIVTRIEKNSASNETGIWDKVVTADGKVGYVCRIYKDGADVYLKEYKYTKVENVNFEKEKYELFAGDTLKLNITIAPDNATYKNVTFTSSDITVATIDATGTVKPIKAGTTVITVTTEDQMKSATCEITVLPKITIDKEKYTVEIYEEFEPVIQVQGTEDVEYILSVKDEGIVTINENKFTGVTVGKTTLVAKLLNYENIMVEAEIEVIAKESEENEEKPEKLEIIFADTLKAKDNVITGVVPNTSIDSFKPLITTNGDIIILDNTGKEITEGVIGTGSKISISHDEEKQEYIIVICGDVTGEGLINSADLLRLVKHLKSGTEINTFAGDVTKDGSINSADLLRVVKYLKGTATIDFN